MRHCVCKCLFACTYASSRGAGLLALVGVNVYALCACVSVCVLQWLRMRACNRLSHVSKGLRASML